MDAIKPLSLPSLQLPQLPSRLDAHDHLHNHEQLPIIPSIPNLPSPDKFMGTLRQIIDGGDTPNTDDYQVPSLPAHIPRPPLHAPNSYPYPPYLHPYPYPYSNPPSYSNQYQQSHFAQPSCGNLLFGCQPKVQAVPCYGSTQTWPPAYNPPSTYSYSNRPPSPPAYFNANSVVSPYDVFSKPGPPYPSEPFVSSMSPISIDRLQNTVKDQPKVSNSQRTDSKPESSNNETMEKNRDTIEMNDDVAALIPTTTTATITPTEVPPSMDEHIKKLSEKLDSHVENLEKFREMARKKLRDALERSNTSDEYENIEKYMPTFHKRHTIKGVQTNPHYTNSVW